MRRNAAFLLVVTLISTSTGCALGKKIFPPKSTATQHNLGSTDMYAMPAETQAYPTEAITAYEPIAQQTSLAATNVQSTYPVGYTNARYHVVSKNDTLFGIARVHYGDQSRWKEIYAANRNEIHDPNMIRVGQRLLIP